MGAGRAIYVDADPQWKRTGYRYFPYAAQQSGTWWVPRFNFGFPEHDMYTVFIDGRAVDGYPALESGTAAAIVGEVARYVEYGSEHGEECIFCSNDRDGMARDA